MPEKKSPQDFDHPTHNTLVAIVFVVILIVLIFFIAIMRRDNVTKDVPKRPAELDQEQVLENLTAPYDDSASYPDPKIIDRLTAQ
ncbi:MAG: hypothetical protein AAB407_01465 [Patescibacteria group bacterium]